MGSMLGTLILDNNPMRVLFRTEAEVGINSHTQVRLKLILPCTWFNVDFALPRTIGSLSSKKTGMHGQLARFWKADIVFTVWARTLLIWRTSVTWHMKVRGSFWKNARVGLILQSIEGSLQMWLDWTQWQGFQLLHQWNWLSHKWSRCH